MSDSIRSTERRAVGAYQPIEVIEEAEAPMPEPSPEAGGEITPVQPHATSAAFPPVAATPIAVRFGSAASALAFAGQLLAAGRIQELAFWSDADEARWVSARTELDMARQLAGVTCGDVFVVAGTSRLVEDLGWGDAQTAIGRTNARSADADALVPASLAEMVKIAGLHPVQEHPMAQAHVLMPGYLSSRVLRRALDLRLDVAHRPVRLHPLFAEDGGGAEPSSLALIQMRLSCRRGNIPASLLTALTREPSLCVCRAAGDSESLLVEYGTASPLLDHLLAGLMNDQSWVLSSGRLGCHIIEPGSVFTDSATSARLSDSRSLQSPVAIPSDDRPATMQLQVVRQQTPGQAVDAILLNSGDLDATVMLLEGHPLSESAQLVRGREWHLLIAPGGVLERLPVGEPLYCIGPGLLYLPLGFGTRPQLPSSARLALFGANEQTAVVVLQTTVLQFSLEHREPVWALWVGPPPAIDVQLPAESTAVLRSLLASADDSPDTAHAATPENADTNQGDRTWLDDAMEAEFRGALALAGELHERHGDPIRAARLFARAAQEERAQQ